jgi:hypothetical protein
MFGRCLHATEHGRVTVSALPATTCRGHRASAGHVRSASRHCNPCPAAATACAHVGSLLSRRRRHRPFRGSLRGTTHAWAFSADALARWGRPARNDSERDDHRRRMS